MNLSLWAIDRLRSTTIDGCMQSPHDPGTFRWSLAISEFFPSNWSITLPFIYHTKYRCFLTLGICHFGLLIVFDRTTNDGCMQSPHDPGTFRWSLAITELFPSDWSINLPFIYQTQYRFVSDCHSWCHFGRLIVFYRLLTTVGFCCMQSLTLYTSWQM